MYRRKTFGQAVTELRINQGKKQSHLAKELGISAAYLSDIERDRRNPGGEELIAKLAQKLDVNPAALAIRAGQLPPQMRDVAESLDDTQLVKAVDAFVNAPSDG